MSTDYIFFLFVLEGRMSQWPSGRSSSYFLLCSWRDPDKTTLEVSFNQFTLKERASFRTEKLF